MQKLKLGQRVWYYGDKRIIVGKRKGSYYMSAPEGMPVLNDPSIKWLSWVKPDTKCVLMFVGSVQVTPPKFKKGDIVRFQKQKAEVVYQYDQCGKELYLLRGLKQSYPDVRPEQIRMRVS